MIYGLVLFVFTLYSCSNEEETIRKKELQEIIIGRSYLDGGSTVATIWRNGEPSRLGDESLTFFPIDATVFNDELYVIGVRRVAGSRQAILLKNNKVTVLWEASRNAAPKGIFVNAQGVYVVGFEHQQGQNQKAVIWNDGKKTILAEEGNSSGEAVKVHNGKVYVVGSQNNNRGLFDAVLWIDGVPKVLEKENPTRLGIRLANDLCIGNDEILIVGVELGNAILWKDNKRTLLSEKAESYGILKTNNSYKIIGSRRSPDRKATVWDGNNGRTELQGGQGANDITVHNGDTYIVGIGKDRTAMYWKNQKATTLKKLSDQVKTSDSVVICFYEK